MIVTEEEAKTKRCQEAFSAALLMTRDGGLVASAAIPLAGVHAVHTAPTHCIGSVCMSWNWLYGNKDGAGIDRTKGDDNARGFCGKAGG